MTDDLFELAPPPDPADLADPGPADLFELAECPGCALELFELAPAP